MTTAKRVLVVDDAELVRKTMRALLVRVGHEVRVASSVAEARRNLDGWWPDCVVLDHRLPDGDGLTLATELCAQAERRRTLRVIVMSGDVLPSTDASPVDVFLLKPAGAREVLAAIEGSAAS